MIPDRAYDLPISHYEFRLLAVICRLAGQEGTVDVRIADLCTLTQGPSEKTVRRALKALEGHGLISRRRLRSAGGYLDTYEYTVISLPDTDDRLENSLADISVRTEVSISNETRGTTSTSSNLFQVERLIDRDTTYPLNPCGISEENPMHFTDNDDENIGGFGLLEPRAVEQKVRKNDPKTRYKRPQHEWTPSDVAAEFNKQVCNRCPWLPGLVNQRALAGALAKYRVQYQTNALVELELLKLFMDDDRNFTHVGAEDTTLYKKFLASFRTKINQARDNLGIVMPSEPEQNVTPAAPMLRASDGREFPNTMSGRLMLERYESRSNK